MASELFIKYPFNMSQRQSDTDLIRAIWKCRFPYAIFFRKSFFKNLFFSFSCLFLTSLFYSATVAWSGNIGSGRDRTDAMDKEEKMSSLPWVVHSRCAQRHPSTILLKTLMSKGQQGRQPEALAAKRGKQRLLPRAGQRAPGSALAWSPSELLAPIKTQFSCVTRSLNPASCCK